MCAFYVCLLCVFHVYCVYDFIINKTIIHQQQHLAAYRNRSKEGNSIMKHRTCVFQTSTNREKFNSMSYYTLLVIVNDV